MAQQQAHAAPPAQASAERWKYDPVKEKWEPSATVLKEVLPPSRSRARALCSSSLRARSLSSFDAAPPIYLSPLFLLSPSSLPPLCLPSPSSLPPPSILPPSIHLSPFPVSQSSPFLPAANVSLVLTPSSIFLPMLTPPLSCPTFAEIFP